MLRYQNTRVVDEGGREGEGGRSWEVQEGHIGRHRLTGEPRSGFADRSIRRHSRCSVSYGRMWRGSHCALIDTEATPQSPAQIRQQASCGIKISNLNFVEDVF